MDVIKSWQGEGSQDSAGEVYTVVGATTADEACEGVRSAYAIQEQVTRFETNARLLCQRITARAIGFSVFEVRVEFGLPAGGGEPSASKPTTWTWSISKTAEPVDRTAYGDPITNSAREVPDNLPTAQVTDLILTVRKVRADYDPEFALRFMDKVNAAPFRVAGKTLKAFTMLCESIIPAGEQRAGQRVTVVHTFRIRGDGWGLRILDQGTGEIRENNGDLPIRFIVFRDAKGNPQPKPRMLNGRGRALVDSNGLVDITSGIGFPAGATAEYQPAPGKDTTAVFLKYPLYQAVNFEALELGI